MAARIKLKHECLAAKVRAGKLSQNHWALRLGLDRGHFSQLLRGKRPYPNEATRRKLLDGLGLPFEELFETEAPLEAQASTDLAPVPVREVRGRRPFFEERENIMELLIKDVSQAIRRLTRSPGFVALAVLPLALGIGANSTIFSFVNGALLRPLPAEQPEELRRLYLKIQGNVSSARISYPDYVDFRDRGEAFSDLAAVSLVPVALTVGEQSDQLLAEVVSGNLFPALGLKSILGRTLTEADDQPGGERVAVLGHRFWQRRFGADPDIVGSRVGLNGEPFLVVGVAAPEYTGIFAGVAIDIWTPIGPSGRWFGPDWRFDRSRNRFQVLGRLRPGFDDERAEAAMSHLATLLEKEFPEIEAGRQVELEPATLLSGQIRRVVSGFFAVVMLIVGLVLLLACANIAHLLVARAIDRRQETAIRLALGAGRLRLGRQYVIESVVLSLVGGVLGFLMAVWSARLLATWNPIRFAPLRLDFEPDARVLLFTFAVALLTGVLLGMVPLLQAARRDLVPALKGEAGVALGKPRRARMRSAFLVTQISLSLVLLVCAALFLRSLARVHTADPGFATDRAIALDLDLESAGLTEEEGRQFFRQLLDHLKTLPGIESASLADLAPLDLATSRRSVEIAGFEPADDGPGLRLSMNRIAPGYFDTVDIPLLAGREFDWRDADPADVGMAPAPIAAPIAVIVNQTLAQRFWPGEDPIGQSFRVRGFSQGLNDGDVARSARVVGLAQDIKYRTFGEEPTAHFYLPLEQDFQLSMTLLARTRGEPRAMITTVQQELQGLHGDVQGFFSRTIEDHLAFAFLPARVAAVVFSLFGFVALVLATVGIYGAVTYSVVGRTRELGIRVALGALHGDIVRMVLRESLVVTAVGLTLGLAMALALGRLLSALLVGVSASDPLILTGVMALVVAVVLVASYVPARRASRVDPLLALRQE